MMNSAKAGRRPECHRDSLAIHCAAASPKTYRRSNPANNIDAPLVLGAKVNRPCELTGTESARFAAAKPLREVRS